MNKKINEQILMMNYAINGTISVYGLLARKHGLNYNSLMTLYAIEENEKCTQKSICDMLQLPKSTIHSILLDFVKKGYMTLQTEPGNKKEKFICLSHEGKTYLQNIMAEIHQAENRAMMTLGEELCAQLVSSNMAFYEAFRAEVEHE